MTLLVSGLAVLLALPGELRVVAIDDATGFPAPQAEIYAVDGPSRRAAPSELRDRAWVAAHGRRLDTARRGFATVDAGNPCDWIVAFDGDAAASDPLFAELSDLQVLRLCRPPARPVRVDVIDASGAPQSRVTVRLLWSGCLGWGEVDEAISDAQGRATFIGGAHYASWMSASREDTWTIAPASVHAQDSDVSLALALDALPTEPLRLVVPRQVPAELLVATPPGPGPLPPLEVVIAPKREPVDYDGSYANSRTLRRSIVPGVPLRLDVEPGTTFSAAFELEEGWGRWFEHSFVVNDDPASWRVTLAVDGSELRRVTVVASDESGAPLANDELAWDVVSNPDLCDPGAWDRRARGFFRARVRTGPDGSVDLFVLPDEASGEPVPRLRLLDLNLDPADIHRSGHCRRWGERPLAELLKATTPTTIRLDAPPLLLAGRIVDLQGRPLAGARLTLYPFDHYGFTGEHSLRSDGLGRFAFFGSVIEHEDVYLALDAVDGALLHPTHDRLADRPGPAPLLAIRRGTTDIDVVVDAPALDLVALVLDPGIDPEALRISSDTGQTRHDDDVVFSSRGPPGRYELTIQREVAGKPPTTIRIPRERRDHLDARLEVIDLRGKL